MKNYKYVGLFLLILSIIACDDKKLELDLIQKPAQPPKVELNINGLNLSKYVAIGASYTAGFTDGALFRLGQENSFPSILSKKFNLATKSTFKQPLMKDNIGGFINKNFGGPRYYFDWKKKRPVQLDATGTTSSKEKLFGSFNNYGVPGVKSYQLTMQAYGIFNPYFGRMASFISTTILDDVLEEKPTFFTLSEIGGNDVLSYALDGGSTGKDQTGNLDTSSYGFKDITDPTAFKNAFTNLIEKLTKNGAKGVVTNIPYVTYLPFFTTVPYNLHLKSAEAKNLNMGYKMLNTAVKMALNGLVSAGKITQEKADLELKKRTIKFTEGMNPLVIIDKSLIDLTSVDSSLRSIRQATEKDLLLVTSSPIIGKAASGDLSRINGLTEPLADKYVLTEDEVKKVKKATDAYNTTIENIAKTNKNIALMDFKTIAKNATVRGIPFDNYVLTTTFATGGLISLDGLHPTPRGYALMANKILEAMDTKFGSNFTKATNGLAKAKDYLVTFPAPMKENK